jgi:hypothetical protein
MPIQGAGQLLAILSERQVGDRGVPAGPTPFSFAMSDQKEACRHAVHRIATAASFDASSLLPA